MEMVENRLMHLIGPTGRFAGFPKLVEALRSGSDQDLVDHVVSKMSTHYSYFFREPIHFQFLQDRLLTTWKHRETIHILSAACAGGQEAWSCAMCVRGMQALAGQNPSDRPGARQKVSIEGIDVAPESIKQARRGVYQAKDVLPFVAESARRKYFQELPTGEFRINANLRPLCSFTVMNLLQNQHMAPASCDLVFLRTVLIYFRPDERRDLLARIHRILKPDGYLIISLSENLADLHVPFRAHRYSIHTPK